MVSSCFRAALCVALHLVISFSMTGQITERQRPQEWSKIIKGSRFADRFLPMAGNERNAGWGADSVSARFTDNGIESDSISFWGGNIIRDDNGVYHLFVCGWPESSPNGHMFWPNSTVYHAVSDNQSGPFIIRNSIGKGHNPEAFVLDDGRVIVYVIDGYYIADSLDSLIWTYGKFDFDTRGHKIIEGLSNLTFTRRPDGSFLMIDRGGGVWISKDGISTYHLLSDKSVYPPVEGEFEDPVVWRDSVQYNLIVNDWLGRIAYFMRSPDGVEWETEIGEAYMPGIARHPDGKSEAWFKYERPKVYLDESGHVKQMNFAVIDTIKWNDLPCDRHSSKNICIPMRPTMNICLEKVASRNIDISVSSETGFDPCLELDPTSVRLGEANDVNIGKGISPVGSRMKENRLILTFPKKGLASPSTLKLVGLDRSGNMHSGYVNYPESRMRRPILSPGKVSYDKDAGIMEIEITNFGLSESGQSLAVVTAGGKTIGTLDIPPLRPYESATLRLAVTDLPDDTPVSVEIVKP